MRRHALRQLLLEQRGVGRTYKGMDGYAPMAGYLGREGYCLELRAGSPHCQNATPASLTRVLGRARQLTAAPVHYLIKWKPRPSKRAAVFEVRESRIHAGFDDPLRRVMRVTERTIDRP